MVPSQQICNFFTAEHIVEGQTIQMFLKDANLAVVPGGAPSKFYALDGSFFTEYWNRDMITGASPLPGGRNPLKPSDRVMEAIGSKVNIGNFVILLQKINLMKASVINPALFFFILRADGY